MDHELYDRIIEDFNYTLSITDTAHRLKVSEERVRRTLITEGLWSSRTSEAIGRLYRQGKSVPEIAEALTMSVKNVQSYVPYSRGQYGGERTDTAKRSDAYRKRMRSAAEKMVEREKGKEKEKEKEKATEMETGMAHSDSTDNLNRGVKKQGKAGKTEENHMRTVATAIRGINTNAGIRKTYTQWIAYLKERERMIRQNLFQSGDSVYKVRFELCGSFYFGADRDMGLEVSERQEFLGYAKAKEGLVREVLIPGEMNLHALNYLIQRLYGWQNSHLHNFSLKKEEFEKLTGGIVEGWLALCGTLLRFPTDNYDDLYRADDYRPEMSVKNWLKMMYRAPYRHDVEADTVEGCAKEICSLLEHFPWITGDMTLKELNERIIFEEDFNTLQEGLTLYEVLQMFRELYYLYDYGDGWCVRISPVEKYDRKTDAGLPDQPLCTLVDGLGVLDDVGGIYGMLEFYRTLNSADAEEKRETREWARMLGWTGRMTKAENMV
ncbi:MAG: hypothetical protein IJP92_12310 [Lachnospiraceae bacterium]|nr:hypothetical protein [Lachnospiraceae bacterium]